MRVDDFLENILDNNNEVNVWVRKENKDGTYTAVANYKGCDTAYVEYDGTENIKDFTFDLKRKFLQITI